VSPGKRHAADWKDAAAYAPLLQVGRSGFAWEWLRRDESYRAAAVREVSWDSLEQVTVGNPAATRWGLHAFEAPDRSAIAARPVWRRAIFPYVLEADAADEGDDRDRLDLERLGHFVTLVADPDGTEHLLLSDGSRSIRVDIASGTVQARPALLRYRLAGFRIAEPMLVLRQLLALCCSGEFSAVLHPREQRAARWILLLRTYDALAAGASQRDIAEGLLGLEPIGRWRLQASSLRSRAQRLVREARQMAAGGYLSLLNGPQSGSYSPSDSGSTGEKLRRR
jgi:hypothetical protein